MTICLTATRTNKVILSIEISSSFHFSKLRMDLCVCSLAFLIMKNVNEPLAPPIPDCLGARFRKLLQNKGENLHCMPI